MFRIAVSLIAAVAVIGIVSGCSTAPKTEAQRVELHQDVHTAIASFKQEDPDLYRFFNNSYGYAIFPRVGKGAAGLGGAYGQGELYENGRMIGYCDLSQTTVGLQLGGQTYSEIIFFRDQWALDNFKQGELVFAANASAVAVDSGSSGSADYRNGVAVFTMTIEGLMFEAAIGGQEFKYVSIWDAEPARYSSESARY